MTAGRWPARALLWTLTAALVVFVAALAWAVTIAGGGWYLLGAAVFFCVPLPLWYVLTNRRRGKDDASR
ncbi:hypothetical protein ACFY1L_48410 [Streptomyces sp. NPDC001663]|uniref:hypothetical protein n=1 Tax=Streptomyces sp. NPDC001663 TaxID=3364597 RepID=UPI00368746E3